MFIHMIEPLQHFIQRQPGWEKARVDRLVRMSGGASKETWAFDLTPGEPGAPIPLVLRIERSSPLPVSLDLEAEFRLLREVYQAGLPVPQPYWQGREALGSPFTVTARLEGETLVRRLHREERFARARQILPEQLVETLARIHGLPLAGGRFDFLPRRCQSRTPALAELLFYENLLNQHAPDPHPAIEFVIRWLKRRLPPSRDPVLLHGDYRLGNVIFTETGMQAVLDWELAHWGDAHEDVGFISVQAWRFGRDDLPVGGIGRREDFYRAYEQAGGGPLDRESLLFWEVFGNLKWSIITILQAGPFLHGASDSIELASLGRKTGEVELQMLTLIEDH